MVVVRMNENEYGILLKLKDRSTEKTVSNYLRKIALKQPVTFFYRNQSADDFLQEMILLKRELHFIGHNFNQAVHKLHMLDKIPEFRNWIQDYHRLNKDFIQKTDQIISQCNQIYQLWLQE